MNEKEIVNIVLTSDQFQNHTKFFLDNLKKFKDEQDQKINAIQADFEKTVDNANQISKDNSRLNEKITELTSQTSKLSSEKLILENELENKKIQLTALNDKIVQLTNLSDLLQQKNEECEKKIATVSKITDELQIAKEKITSQATIIDELNKKLSVSIFVKAGEIFEVYKTMSPDTKNRLEAVFEVETLEGFIANGLQFENISILWDFMKRKVIDKDDNDIDNLLKIFDFFFKFYNLGSKESRYVLIEPKTGDSFDRNNCSIIGTEVDGKIAKVHIPGYKDVKTGDVKKAIVSVK